MSRVAVVTGAGRGIGASTAVTLAEAGWDIAVSYQPMRPRRATS